MSSPSTVRLASETDFGGFRRAARALLANGVAPDAVLWLVANAADLFADDGGLSEDADASAPASVDEGAHAAVHEAPRISRELLAMFESASLHCEPERFGLLYRVLWRLAHTPALRHDPLDPDLARIRLMARAVDREIHKMHAFVRFRPVRPTDDDGYAGDDTADGVLHVAWFEPEHHIVAAAGPFFARRFANLRWAILTPRCSLAWDGSRLRQGPGASRDAAPGPDDGETLWLAYYRSIFNPARLKLRTMEKEMPRRYWRNLPEASLIAPLADAAAERTHRMIELVDERRGRPGMRAGLAAGGGSRAQHASPAGSAAALVATDAGLAELHEAAEHCRDCPIGEHATQVVFGEGPMQPGLMLVGEQPGDQEDLRGHPFVGPAGKLLARAMGELGWQREQVFMTNAVKHFKFELRGKRRMHKTPAQREIEICSQWLEREISLVRPRAAVALGATAARALLHSAVAVTRERGQWLQRPDGLRVLITLHPSALLRGPKEERDAAFTRWLADLKKATAFAQRDAATAQAQR